MSISDIPLRKKLALSLFSRYKAAEAKIHRLNYILWECTLRCNLSCLHCGSDCKKDSSICDMPAKDFLGALDSITDILEPNNTMIVLTGPGPLHCGGPGGERARGHDAHKALLGA